MLWDFSPDCISLDHTPITAVHYRKTFQTGWAKLRIPNLPDISVRPSPNLCSPTVTSFEEKRKKKKIGLDENKYFIGASVRVLMEFFRP